MGGAYLVTWTVLCFRFHTLWSLQHSKASCYFQTFAELHLSIHDLCPSKPRPFAQIKIYASAHAKIFTAQRPLGNESLVALQWVFMLQALACDILPQTPSKYTYYIIRFKMGPFRNIYMWRVLSSMCEVGVWCFRASLCTKLLADFRLHTSLGWITPQLASPSSGTCWTLTLTPDTRSVPLTCWCLHAFFWGFLPPTLI